MVSVTFFNPNTNRRLATELDEQMTVGEAIQNLLERDFITAPTNGEHYTLHIKGKTELTSDDATLASGGIAAGDTISVACVQRGGARW